MRDRHGLPCENAITAQCLELRVCYRRERDECPLVARRTPRRLRVGAGRQRAPRGVRHLLWEAAEHRRLSSESAELELR